MTAPSFAARVWLAAGDPQQLLPAREQMAFTLGFHIILVPFGVALTTLMLIAHYRGVRHNDRAALLLARRWSKVAAVLFAVGAVSGTVLQFEMGILWPGLMKQYGPAFGFPFAIEGLFFFLEAIFVSIYIYGWDRLGTRLHFASGVVVSIASAGGAAAVVAANGWMNRPGGITMRDGKLVAVEPALVFFNNAFWLEFLHMLTAAYIVAGFVVAGVYATGILRGRRTRYHQLGLVIGFTTAAVGLPVQVVLGDLIARHVYKEEPAKFAAIELLPTTGSHVPETLGGVLVDGKVQGGVPIPDMASQLAGFKPSTVIRGLDLIPVDVRPPDHLVNIVHLAFDTMVGTTALLLGSGVWFAWLWWRHRTTLTTNRWFLRAASICGAISVVSMESGWVVTEVGRQPWTVVGLLLTRDAVTTHGNLWPMFAGVVVIYAAVGTAAIAVLRSMARRWQDDGDDAVAVPYGPKRFGGNRSEELVS
ncbi:cytochrome ubiquinol oxidase subunit I [Mycobacterium sherrisii]|uniref:Cytochrome BD ubiquinol oxidase subunit I n=2 Tax=Mycobacterium sherrisii TaxID=243061 RepID=A0A1E3SV88_9MYCO|nr:cytochrome ubiquinol oxidase subunit I [Mycobacterium sherrisii]MCV7032006.1 cytochrome ubiquinol oxidase subunit I [Mycobacterium sherrisii]MEC4764004.1 cytochrome ubiquinol oxidase subunit I [Mycobacterium sherrisii]ODR06062.1 cytochrome BD ubiquinol oxidase subunit I [Mycobacterium sherrisii]ORW76730.1 cytochrome BD ubiquinol oxidase subunit I [Mycobacterium sherrisii]